MGSNLFFLGIVLILEVTLLPSMAIAAESQDTPVVTITKPKNGEMHMFGIRGLAATVIMNSEPVAVNRVQFFQRWNITDSPFVMKFEKDGTSNGDGKWWAESYFETQPNMLNPEIAIFAIACFQFNGITGKCENSITS